MATSPTTGATRTPMPAPAPGDTPAPGDPPAPGADAFALPGSRGPAPYSPFALLNDEPVAEPGADLLGAGRAAAQLAGLLVASRQSTPFTLAVDAGWGMGKSSLMRLVDAELAQAPEVHTVWYNAWTSTGADALEGLIKSVLMRFDRRVLRRGLQRVSERRALLRFTRALTTVAAGPLGVSGLVDELWKTLSVNSQARNEMRGAIGQLVQEWSETAEFQPQRLLVVFIDDLDRCSEETVLAVCEAVKVYLDVPGLAFVVGCDRSALGPNGLLRDLSPAGSAFMEKIFQTSYRIPAPDGQGVKDYIRWCARTAGVEPLLDEALVDLLAERSGRNPRRIKRLVNGFVLEATLNPVWRDFGPGAVLRTLLLQYFYPDFYRMMTGPSGTLDGDVVAEFRRYREVRRTLLSATGGASAEELATVRDFLAPYDLVPPEPPGAGGEAVLAALERQLPNEFPDLVLNPAFTSLVDELTARPDAVQLLLRLREGPVGSGTEPTPMSREWAPLWRGLSVPFPDGSGSGFGPPLAWPADGVPLAGYPAQGAPLGYPAQGAPPQQAQTPPPQTYPNMPYADPVEPAPPYGQQPAYQQQGAYGQAPQPGYPTQQGGYPAQSPYPQPAYSPLLDVLWVDDQPDRKAVVREVLESLGAQVRHESTSRAAGRAVRDRRPDLLISDISRGRDRVAGFDMVARLKRDGVYDGPVIFYTIRQSPEREERAAELGARLTNNEQKLRDLVVAALQEPVRPPAQQPGSSPPPLAPPVRDLSVLWVDERLGDSFMGLVAELRGEGAAVHLANNDQEALDWLAEHRADLVLSDIARYADGYGNPDGGFTFAERLRQEGGYRGPLGFFASWVTPAREERARELGALGVATDPVVVREWVDEIAWGLRERPRWPGRS
ncbi:response regulator [Streptomyces piniterrae]|uniref:Response regulator n=1 Tax=Streptomyces piniterrae TaxID=2571125 RepID=A0A4U0MXL0_9ACTN|nr:P-loop NTPase fold protein [Streptomyces piniterrae]TJZ45362.1 response regulator [Streptomyces piniterrae]